MYLLSHPYIALTRPPGAFDYLMNPKSGRNLSALAFLLALSTFACASALSSNIANASLPAVSPAQLPIGTILPVTLDQTISLEQARAGQVIEARLAQQVFLSKHDKLEIKSRLTGSIVSVVKASDGTVDLSLRFDKIQYHKQMIPLTASLRALASYEAVRTSQTPYIGADTGTPTGWADTTQIGGDIRFGDGGEVRNRQKQKVGKGVIGGVLVHVSAVPGTDCEGPINGDDRLQALWVFSSDACGVYGLPAVHIAHTGKTAPIAVITLRFEKPDMKLDASDALLLRVVSPN
jgi:hypothetical protein